jgi:YidC/Oxa1 family membrane protein insertase
MNKNNILAALFMGLLFIGWMFWQQSANKPVPQKQNTEQTVQKESKPEEAKPEPSTTPKTVTTATDTVADSLAPEKPSPYGIFKNAAQGTKQVITVETDMFTAKFSSKGGALIEYTLKKYLKWNKRPAQLVKNREGQLYLSFRSLDGKPIDTRDLYFVFDTDKNFIKLSGKETITIKAIMKLDSGKKIVKEFTFSGNKYDFMMNIQLVNVEDYIPRNGFNLMWDSGLTYQEHNSVDESSSSVAVVSRLGKIDEFNAKHREMEGESYTGTIDYIATKTKYFGLAIIPKPDQAFNGTCDLYGKEKTFANKGKAKEYDISLRVPYNGGSRSSSYQIYLGPLDYKILKEYGLRDLVNFGWRFVIRQIGEYFMLPIFNAIHSIVPSWGLTLIIFAFLMKILLYPFSIQQMRSAQKMKLLQPEMEKMREKYADDQKAQQREQMKLYSDHGINPAGGCLPLLLQMPILFSLFSVLRNAISLRQSSFIWWIHDLSVPDKILDLGTSFFGISFISGLALLMGITMFFQQKLTVTDPKQKAMVYIMPVMFTLMFASLPAGLNLYYFIFNLLSIAQQVYMNKFSRKKFTLEDMKKAPKKEGWMQKRLKEAQEIAEKKGTTAPTSLSNRYKDLDTKKNYRKKKK